MLQRYILYTLASYCGYAFFTIYEFNICANILFIYLTHMQGELILPKYISKTWPYLQMVKIASTCNTNLNQVTKSYSCETLTWKPKKRKDYLYVVVINYQKGAEWMLHIWFYNEYIYWINVIYKCFLCDTFKSTSKGWSR